MALINFGVYAFYAYLAIGLVTGLGLLFKGLSVIDPVTKGSSIGFKLLIFPGIVAFWPYLIKLWLTTSSHD